MKLDIHIHSTYSDCSSLEVGVICERVSREKLPVFTLTDHGTARGCEDLEISCIHSRIVYGVEIIAQEGDFLIYSLDVDYVKSLNVYQESVKSLKRNDHTAIIWAHPRVPTRESIGWTSPNDQNRIIAEVMEHIDGLELFNGTMLNLAANGVVQRIYYSNLMGIAKRAKLTLTGASDAHDPINFYTAWTEFSDDVKTPKDFIQALKTGNVKPGYDHDFYKINVP